MNTLDLSQHSKDNLSLMIELIEKERKELEFVISATASEISRAEDMSEDLMARLCSSIAEHKKKLETLYAWRMIFLNAWVNASKPVVETIIK